MSGSNYKIISLKNKVLLLKYLQTYFPKKKNTQILKMRLII